MLRWRSAGAITRHGCYCAFAVLLLLCAGLCSHCALPAYVQRRDTLPYTRAAASTCEHSVPPSLPCSSVSLGPYLCYPAFSSSLPYPSFIPTFPSLVSSSFLQDLH